jgi:hypothetical protein
MVPRPSSSEVTTGSLSASGGHEDKKPMIRHKAELWFHSPVFSGTKCVDTADLSF